MSIVLDTLSWKVMSSKLEKQGNKEHLVMLNNVNVGITYGKY